MQYSGLQIVSFVVLLAGTAAVVVAVATDFWSYHSSDVGVSRKSYRGLWRICDEVSVTVIAIKSSSYKCSNRFEINAENPTDVQFTYEDYKPWEVACLGLMCGSALLGILSLLFSPCCCNRCGICLSLCVLLAALACAGGVGVYAYQTQRGAVTVLKFGDVRTDIETGMKYTLGWSFWLAVGGGGAQLLASILFGASRARQHNYAM